MKRLDFSPSEIRQRDPVKVCSLGSLVDKAALMMGLLGFCHSPAINLIHDRA